MYATNTQQVTLQKYATNPPADLGELREYVTVCAEVNKDTNGDLYGTIGVLIDRIQANLQLIHKLEKGK